MEVEEMRRWAGVKGLLSQPELELMKKRGGLLENLA